MSVNPPPYVFDITTVLPALPICRAHGILVYVKSINLKLKVFIPLLIYLMPRRHVTPCGITILFNSTFINYSNCVLNLLDSQDYLTT